MRSFTNDTADQRISPGESLYGGSSPDFDEKKVTEKNEDRVAKNNDTLSKSSMFSYFVKNILNKNKQRSYPDINNVPD